MGNKSSSDSMVTLNEDENDDNERHVPSPKPSVSKSSSELFIKVLRQFSLPLNEVEVQDLRYNLEEIVYTPNTTILHEGSKGVGIFVIVKGTCNIIASDGQTTMRQLTQNEIFGEVSSVYDISCTCSVKVNSEDCTLLFLNISKTKRLFTITENNQIPLRQWFIQQGYLDSACLFSSYNIPRSIIQRFIPLYSLFYGWSDSALMEIIKTLPKDCIEIHQPNTYLCIEDETIDNGAFFVLDGTIQLIKENELFLTIDANSVKVLFHEENLFYEDTKAFYTIKIVQTCQIVTLHQEYLHSIIKKFPAECSKLMELNKMWKSYIDRTKEMNKYREYVYPIYVCSCLRKTKALYKLAEVFLHEIALKMEFISYDVNQTVFEVDEDLDNKAFMMVVLKGLLIVSNNSASHKELKRYETFYFTPKLSAKTKIIAKSQTIIGLVGRNVVEEVEVKYYNEKKILW